MMAIWKGIRKTVGQLGLSLALVAGVAASAAAAPMPKPLDPPAHVVIAEDGSPSGAGFYLANAFGYFKQLGIEVEFKTFQSSADMLPAVATGQVDVAGGIMTDSLFNAVKRGLDIKIIGDKGYNVPGHPYFEVVVRRDLADKITAYRDLKGKRIGVVCTGCIVDMILSRALQAGGLTLADVKLYKIDGFSNVLTALATKQLDAAVEIEPQITEGVKKGIVVRWKDPAEYDPGDQIAVMLASPQFTSSKRDVALRFMIAYIQALRDHNRAFFGDHQNRDAVVKVLTQYTVLTNPADWIEANPPGLNPDGMVNPAGIRVDYAWFKAMGLFEGDVDVDHMIDNSLVQDALAVLGRASAH